METKKEDTLKEVSTQGLSHFRVHNDIWIYRMVVGFLGATLLTALTGGIFLQINGKETPQIVTVLGNGALGAMTILLIDSPNKRNRKNQP